MILPIYAYGHPVLNKVCKEIDRDYDRLPELIDNMYETMYNAEGVGLAAPQVGLPIRVFVVDTVQLDEEEKNGFKQVFINPVMIEEVGELWSYEEGCLSIPAIRGDVERQPQITIQYLDENFEEHTRTFKGVNARVVQHELDHLEGILFTEKLKPIKKRLVRRKLADLQKGKAKNISYPMKFGTR